MPGLADERRHRLLFCEQCGDDYSLVASSSDAARQIAPLRTCPSCQLLSCLLCWPIGGSRCAACRIAQAVRLREVRPGPVAGVAPETPVDIPGSVRAEASQPRTTWGLSTVVVAVAAQTLAVLVLVAVAGGLFPGVGPTDRSGLVPSPTSKPSEVSTSASLRVAPPHALHDAARINTTAKQLVVWEDAFGEVSVRVVATAHNSGTMPVAVSAAASTWTVVSRAGDEVARGRFAHAFPSLLPPDGTVLLIDDLSMSFAEPDELSLLQVELVAEPAGPSGVIPPEFSDSRLTLGPAAEVRPLERPPR